RELIGGRERRRERSVLSGPRGAVLAGDLGPRVAQREARVALVRVLAVLVELGPHGSSLVDGRDGLGRRREREGAGLEARARKVRRERERAVARLDAEVEALVVVRR